MDIGDRQRPLSRRPESWSCSPRGPFAEAFDRALRRHEPNQSALIRALNAQGHRIDRTTLRMWGLDLKTPQRATSFAILAALERRWSFPDGYFRSLLPASERAAYGVPGPGLAPRERHRYLQHLPEDFARRSPAERAEIVDWIRHTFSPDAIANRRYGAEAIRRPYSLRFTELERTRSRRDDDRLRAGTRPAPPQLAAELADLLAFKTATFSPAGRPRAGVWAPATADLHIERFGLMFGALAAAPDGPTPGFGAPLEALTFALLLFPEVWDRYLGFRERRRGFFTAYETDILEDVSALTHAATGWLTQSPALSARLAPIPNLVTAEAIAEARADWPRACARIRAFARMRRAELARLVRRHRDPFLPIRVVLEAERPVTVYRRIADEILARRPDPRRYPMDAAENARAYLMVRLALHLGFRQRTLRELQVRRRGEPISQLGDLEARRCGELRWSLQDRSWEVLAPPSAFKNARSRYFRGHPYLARLPDLAGLYGEIEAYLEVHRPVLLAERSDPGVLFVKAPNARGASPAFNISDFYAAWQALTARYGVYNPYTGRGAIAGLLPHGPHCVRDVLATHVLKLTGSYEQAGYAIQDTPQSVEHHYARFMPQDKAAHAARLLSDVWADA